MRNPSGMHLLSGIDLQSVARRRCLLGLSAILATTAVPAGAAEWKARDDPFTLGVASGDPSPDGFVIWTRLAPRPTEGGGMPDLLLWRPEASDAKLVEVRQGGCSRWSRHR